MDQSTFHKKILKQKFWKKSKGGTTLTFFSGFLQFTLNFKKILISKEVVWVGVGTLTTTMKEISLKYMSFGEIQKVWGFWQNQKKMLFFAVCPQCWGGLDCPILCRAKARRGRARSANFFEIIDPKRSRRSMFWSTILIKIWVQILPKIAILSLFFFNFAHSFCFCHVSEVD